MISTPPKKIHRSVGAIIRKDNKYLLMDRAVKPLGFACIAGHVEKGEDPDHALRREVKEESNLEVTSAKLVGEGVIDDVECVLGITQHEWKVYECQVKGMLRPDAESLSMGWYTKEQMKNLKFEPSWEFWLRRLKII